MLPGALCALSAHFSPFLGGEKLRGPPGTRLAGPAFISSRDPPPQLAEVGREARPSTTGAAAHNRPVWRADARSCSAGAASRGSYQSRAWPGALPSAKCCHYQ